MGRRHGPRQQCRSHTELQAFDGLARALQKYWGILSDAPINHSLASRQGTLCFAYESPKARPTLGRLAVRAIASPGRALRVGGSAFPSRRLEWGPVVGKRCAGPVDAVGQPARQLQYPPGPPPPMGIWCERAHTAGCDTRCTVLFCCWLRVPLLGWLIPLVRLCGWPCWLCLSPRSGAGRAVD